MANVDYSTLYGWADELESLADGQAEDREGHYRRKELLQIASDMRLLANVDEES